MKPKVLRVLGLDAILVPGGFGDRGIEGKSAGGEIRRENKVPYLGICFRYASYPPNTRNVAGMEGHPTEFNKETKYPVVGLITGVGE